MALPNSHLTLGRYRIYENICYGSGVSSFAAPGEDIDTGSPVIVKISRYTHEVPWAYARVAKEPCVLYRIKEVPHALQMRTHFLIPSKGGLKYERYGIVCDLARSTNKPNEIPFTLGDLLTKRKTGALNWQQTISCTKQLAECLAELKKRRIVHRDLKTDNLIFNHDSGLVTVLDFGNSCQFAFLKNDNSATSAHCRPPEMFLYREEKDFGIDIWGLGIILYEMYTGGWVPFPTIDIKNPLTLNSIITNLGLPPDSFLKTCKISKEELAKLVDPKYKLDWKEKIRKAAKRRGDADSRAELVIDFLDRIFRYENRMSAEQALDHPLLEDDVDIKLDSEKVPFPMLKKLAVSIQGLQIPLSSRCVHLPKTPDGQYEINIEELSTKKCLHTFKQTLHRGDTLSISLPPNDLNLKG